MLVLLMLVPGAADVGACTSASADGADAGSGTDPGSGAVLTVLVLVLMHATLLVCLYHHLYTPATKGCTQM